MSLKFYLGASGSGKSYKLHKDIVDWADREKDTDFLFIVPDQFTMQTQIDLVNASLNHGIMNIDVLSFSRLSHRIFEELGCNNNIVLEDTGKSLILRRLSGKIAPELKVLGSNIDKIGYIHEIKSVISELKQYGVDPDMLDRLIAFSSSRGMLKAKLEDIGIIYREFNNYIRDSYITSEETLTLLTDRIGDSKIVKDAVVIFDGFTGFTPIQYRLIQRLLGMTKQVIVSITIDIESSPYLIKGEQELFWLSKKTIKDLQTLAQEINVVQEEDCLLLDNMRFANSPEISHLERHLFRYPVVPYDREPENIFITENSSVDEEVLSACIKIKELVLSEGYEYRSIAVVCGSLDEYKDYFEKYSKIYDIPVFLDETKKITLNPLVEYIRSGLNIISSNFSYDSVLHFLRSGLAPFEEKEVDLLDNYIVRYGIRGKKKYMNAFLFPPYGSGSEPGTDEEKENERAALKELNATRERLVELLLPISFRKNKVSGYVDGINEFMALGGVEDTMSAFITYFKDNFEEEKAGEYEQIQDLIFTLLTQIKELLSEETMDIDEFIKILDSGFDELTVGSIPGGIDKVIVGDIERSRISEPKVLFLLGANDGNIPGSNSKGGLISDMDREFLKESDIELSPTPREQIYTQRLYLYMNLTKPKERLYLSYAGLSSEGKSMRESYLIESIKKLFPLLKVSYSKSDNTRLDKVFGLKDSVAILSDALREYSEGKLSSLTYDEMLSLFGILLDDEITHDITLKLLDTAFFDYKEKPLSKDLAHLLYGSIIYNSVSRLEKYASCQYAHFLSYGMKLAERDEFSIENNDLGTVYHAVLEDFAKSVARDGFTLLNFPENSVDERLDKIITDKAINLKGAILHASGRNEYMIGKIHNIMKLTVLATKKQLQEGKFIPDGFEQEFTETIRPDNDTSINIVGKIDRIDICKTPDEAYVKITDYKSGDKNVELDSLFYGLQIQQPVYMMAALKAVKEKYPDLKARMGAMLYYHIDDPLSDGDENMKEEDAEKALIRALRPKGLVSSDKNVIDNLDRNLTSPSVNSFAIPVETTKDGNISSRSSVLSEEEYEIISGYLKELISDTGQNIMEGRIKINPMEHKGKDSCTYCSYKEICPYDDKLHGFGKRKLKTLSRDEAIEMMKDESSEDFEEEPEN